MGKLTLSKSSFVKGLQCDKHLYLYKHHYSLQDPISETQQLVFNRGHSVGKLAQSLFPGGVDSSPSKPWLYNEAAKKTAALISNGEKIIYEATFVFDDVVVIADILVNDNGNWKFYEVKSSTSISDTYLIDTSIQYYVITKCGLNLSEASIIYINNQYVRKDALDINELFIKESVLEVVKEKQNFIEEEIQRQKNILKLKYIPQIDIGAHCSTPYDCSFINLCWKDIPENSVFDISGLRGKKKFELYNQGIVSLDDLTNDSLSQKQSIQLNSYLTGESVIEKDKIREFISDFEFPLYFMDFESFQPAIPLYPNSKPYQQIPFQYSVHLQQNKDSHVEHFEFLAESSKDVDPRINFIEHLIETLGVNGSIVVYNKSFEITRLKEIASDFPNYSTVIEEIIDRIKDLMIPFQQKWYYTPEMKGSYSIKAVLPALVPDLSYNDLEISDGGSASHIFESLLNENDKEKTNYARSNLLKYCALDTLAMVRVFKILKDFSS
ncbi:MAG: DUF2779 domain-containing protein [Bacteroidetes bacterium]|nr:DUF2779 domain-containing protein [Bacteroidota bacterium]